MVRADWIAVDWGTTHLRAWAMREDGVPLAHAQSEAGMATLTQSAFETALLDLVSDWLDGPTLVLACGMVGSRQGWAEARYAEAPCTPPSGVEAVIAPAKDTRLNVRIIPGIRQSKPADVMRGEETQIAGFLRGHSSFDGVLCLPGTHTKWVQISAGEVVSFRTFMSGELFALLSQNSVLRHSVQSDEWDADAFTEALNDAIARPASFAANLFGLRAGQLVHDTAPGTARARLSGLLLGMELAGARPYWLGQNVAIIGARDLSQRYADALASQGMSAEIHDGASLVIEGLIAAHATMLRSPA